MSLEFVTTSIFDSPAQTLVNPVNCVGVMGAGLAKAFRLRFPKMFEQYEERCLTGRFGMCEPELHDRQTPWVLCFPTKDHWRDKSRVAEIEGGLRTFIRDYERFGITSIAFPKLGCGLGGLDWEREVKPLMFGYLNPLPIKVWVHE
jgi:O-acetyl-ADP-ribose deacetylase (regulator of RNase III)